MIKAQTDSSQITVTWTATSDNGGTAITSYEVWYNQGPITNTFIVNSEVSSATTTETITSVASGDPYIVKIVAKNRLGSSEDSGSVTVYAASVPDAPQAPSRVAGTNAQTTIDIEWTANGNGGSGITVYEVWWNGGGEGPVTGLKVEISSGSTTSTQITGLSPGTYYGFAIKAVNIVGPGSLSSETSLIAATVPEKPAHLSLVSQSETEITVTWEPSIDTGGTPITGYKLQWSENSGSMAELDYTVPSSASSYTVDASTNSVQVGASYSFLVISVNVVGDSDPSDILEDIVAGTPPG